MVLTEQTVIGEVRTLTDYPPSVLSDSDITDIIQTAERDITGITNNYELDFYNVDDIDANRALMWTTCLFAKVKAGELDAAELSLEEIDIQSISAAGKEHGERPVIWYERAWSFIDTLVVIPDEDARNFGLVEVERSNRVYGDDSQSTGLGN